MIQWLRLRAPNAGGPGSIPSQKTRCQMQQRRSKILHAATKPDTAKKKYSEFKTPLKSEIVGSSPNPRCTWIWVLSEEECSFMRMQSHPSVTIALFSFKTLAVQLPGQKQKQNPSVKIWYRGSNVGGWMQGKEETKSPVFISWEPASPPHQPQRSCLINIIWWWCSSSQQHIFPCHFFLAAHNHWQWSCTRTHTHMSIFSFLLQSIW